MSSLAWYWHRLKAMSPAELGAHARRKVHQLSDRYFAQGRFARAGDVSPAAPFPVLPARTAAPEALRQALRADRADILAGRWIAFGRTKLQVEDPPRWHKDYLVNVDLTTRRSALQLHHRLEGKADIKLIWEPSRWYSLVRLAQAAYVLDDSAAANTCCRWLEDWAAENPPYFGWHWISGLESGLRLVQFAWIDALLAATPSAAKPAFFARLREIRRSILPPHLWYTWRDRSFGSSANNHLLGELAGLIVALARWPGLARWAAPLSRLQPLWEREVLTQFAPDGGNREQALNYHLFSWEFCWQSALALRAAGRTLSPEVDDRLRAAIGFFTSVQSETEPWDYGDSDNAYVTPFFLEWPKSTFEWHAWFRHAPAGSGIRYWLKDAPKPIANASVFRPAPGWHVFPETGFAVYRDADWLLRWDLSALGYLRPAGHGHCDALHLSVWFQGRPVLIDPGTGAYHSDRPLRDFLASWEAHNGPHPPAPSVPKRMGTFLYALHHDRPAWQKLSDSALIAELRLPEGVLQRTITRLEAENGWQIDDAFSAAPGQPASPTRVVWQFAPRVTVQALEARTFALGLDGAALRLEVGRDWTTVEPGLVEKGRAPSHPPGLGICSPGFREVVPNSFVRLQGETSPGRVLRTVFRADRHLVA